MAFHKQVNQNHTTLTLSETESRYAVHIGL